MRIDVSFVCFPWKYIICVSQIVHIDRESIKTWKELLPLRWPWLRVLEQLVVFKRNKKHKQNQVKQEYLIDNWHRNRSHGYNKTDSCGHCSKQTTSLNIEQQREAADPTYANMALSLWLGYYIVIFCIHFQTSELKWEKRLIKTNFLTFNTFFTNWM